MPFRLKLSAPDLSRVPCVQDKLRAVEESAVEFRYTEDEVAAQIRRDLSKEKYRIGAPRFSLYLFFAFFAPFRGYSFSLAQVLLDSGPHFGVANQFAIGRSDVTRPITGSDGLADGAIDLFGNRIQSE
jgi:hypothetical protein